MENATGRSQHMETLLAALIIALGKHYNHLREADGQEAIVREWCARSSYGEGKLVQVIESNGSMVGITRGLERDGALRVETSNGIRIVRAGDVTSVRPK